MTSKSPLKLLVMGCGSAGARHIRNLKSLSAVEIIACDRDKERLEYIKKEYGIKTSPDYADTLANQSVSAVLVCTPAVSHVTLALAALRAGCHVFVEKPLSHTLQKVDDLAQEARQRNLVCTVGFNLRFQPGLQKLKELLEEGAVGKPVSARSHFGSNFLYRLPYHRYADYRQDYAARRIGGGVILDAATHHIDYLRWFFGEVSEVFCYAGKMGSLDLAAEDLGELLLKFRRGVVASLHVDFIQKPYQNRCEIIGDSGTINWDFTTNTVSRYSGKEETWQAFPYRDFDHNQTYVAEIRHFLRCIRGEERPVISLSSACHDLEIVLAARTSARTGRRVRLAAEDG